MLEDDLTCNGRYVELGELIDLLYYVAFYHGAPLGERSWPPGIPPKGGNQEGVIIRNQRAWRELGFMARDLDEYISWRQSRVRRLVGPRERRCDECGITYEPFVNDTGICALCILKL